MTKNTFALALLALSPIALATDNRYTDGYTIVEPASMVNASIDQLIYFDAEKCGDTVLEALGVILSGTGYVLAPPAASDPRIKDLYGQPVPQFAGTAKGLQPLSAILKQLGGKGWLLVEDPVRRYVSFRVNPEFATESFSVVD